jgi:hypothetical protein
MSGEDAPRPYLENLIVLEIKTNKQTRATPSSGELALGVARKSGQNSLRLNYI